MAKKHLKPLETSSNNDEAFETFSVDHEDDDTIYLSPSPVTVATSKMKRRSEGTSTYVNSKRAKNVSAEDEKKIEECTTRLRFKRLWNDDDEIVVLQGIIKFEDVTGKSPFEDKQGFIKLIEKSISFEASENQYIDKIRHLKRKYMKKRKNGFSNAHDQKCFKLAMSIWGADEEKSKKMDTLKQDLFSSPNGKNVREDDGSKVLIHGEDVTDWFENSFLLRSVESLGVESVRHKWSMVPIETKKKIEERLELLEANECECKKIEEMLKIKKRECMKQKTDLLNEVISVIT